MSNIPLVRDPLVLLYNYLEEWVENNVHTQTTIVSDIEKELIPKIDKEIKKLTEALAKETAP